ncbi:MAG: 4'-phosphopantetheinyl transferase superfamily protein [Thermoanaerobaculia bacterium]
MRRVDVPAKWSRKLCVVTDFRPDDSSRYFSSREIGALAKFRTAKRREEWALSRIAAKLLAIDRHLCSDPKECSVVSTEEGPRLMIRNQESSWNLSISHSHGLGAAALDAMGIGVDLEKVRDLDEKAFKFFLVPSEIRLMKALPLEHASIHFWCCKEAAWKTQSQELTLRKISVELMDEHRDRLVLKYRAAPSGVVESFSLDANYVGAIAEPTWDSEEFRIPPLETE